MSTSFFRCTAFCVVLFTGALEARAEIYNVRQDFSTTANPNGVWTFGYRPSSSGPMIVYPQYGDPGDGQPSWHDDRYSYYHAPSVYQIAPVYWHYSGYDIGPDDIAFHPGPGFVGNDLDWSIIRWTAPADGVSNVDARFTGGFGTLTGTRDVYVYVNSTSDLSSTIVGTQSASYVKNGLVVHAGDTIDFVVGPHGNLNQDSTAISAIIDFTRVPEPSTIALLAAGAAGLAAWLWRRQRRA
jgi:hypothetical protein